MEEKLNLLDSGSGDGDCGSTLALGAKGTLLENCWRISLYVADDAISKLYAT